MLQLGLNRIRTEAQRLVQHRPGHSAEPAEQHQNKKGPGSPGAPLKYPANNYLVVLLVVYHFSNNIILLFYNLLQLTS